MSHESRARTMEFLIVYLETSANRLGMTIENARWKEPNETPSLDWKEMIGFDYKGERYTEIFSYPELEDADPASSYNGKRTGLCRRIEAKLQQAKAEQG